MDLLIKNRGEKTKLSSLGLFLIDIVDDEYTLEREKKTVRNRSGYLPTRNLVRAKSIEVTAKLIVESLLELEQIKQKLNFLLMSKDPLFIKKLLPKSVNLYEYQLPDINSLLDFKNVETIEGDYGYIVWLTSAPQFDFVGKSQQGLLYEISFTFETANLPYGQTEPSSSILSGKQINYKGNVDCSQLDYPFYFKLTATGYSVGDFFLQINNRKFTYHSADQIKIGDVFLLKGIENSLNNININHKTNYEHFILPATENGIISYTTDFPGRIELINQVELYY